MNFPFSTLFILLHTLNNIPPNLSFSVIDVFCLVIWANKGFYCRIMFQKGIGLLICWLMMGLTIGSNKKLGCILMDIIGVGFEKVQTSKDGLNHFLLVALPRISP